MKLDVRRSLSAWRKIRGLAERGMFVGDSTVLAIEAVMDILGTLRLVRSPSTAKVLQMGVRICDHAHQLLTVVVPLLHLHPALAGVAFHSYAVMQCLQEAKLVLRLSLRVMSWLRQREVRGVDREFGGGAQPDEFSGDFPGRSPVFNDFPEFPELGENGGGSPIMQSDWPSNTYEMLPRNARPND